MIGEYFAVDKDMNISRHRVFRDREFLRGHDGSPVYAPSSDGVNRRDILKSAGDRALKNAFRHAGRAAFLGAAAEFFDHELTEQKKVAAEEDAKAAGEAQDRADAELGRELLRVYRDNGGNTCWQKVAAAARAHFQAGTIFTDGESL